MSLKKEKPGKKLYATGNGRCNFTNLRQEKECYRGGDPDFVMRALGRFGLPETLALFRELGLKEREINGYLYPYSGQAKDVVSLLLNELDALSVTVRCSERVEDIRKESRGFLIRTRSADPKNPSGKEPDCVERTHHAAFVILAPGGCASYRLGSDGSGYELAKRLGHSVIPPVPALVALKTRQNTKPVSGVRFFGSGELYSQGGIFVSCDGEDFSLKEMGFAFSSARFIEQSIGGQPVMCLFCEGALAVFSARGKMVFRNRAKSYSCGDMLRVTINFDTCAGCESECDFSFDGEEMKLISGHTRETRPVGEEIIHFAFFESVLAHGDSSVYLNAELRARADELGGYLGDFAEVLVPPRKFYDFTGERLAAGLAYPLSSNLYRVKFYAADTADGLVCNIRSVDYPPRTAQAARS